MSWKSRYWWWLLLLVPIGIGLTRLRFDIDVLDLLPSQVKAVQGLKLYQDHFANARELAITVQAPTADDTENAAKLLAESLRRHTNLVEQAIWQAPWNEHPGAAADFLAYLWFNQPPEIFDQLTNRLAPANVADEFAAAREKLTTSLSPNEIGQLSYDPLGLTQLPSAASGSAPQFGPGKDMFASNDGTFRMISVRAAAPLPTYSACRDWLNSINQIIQDTRATNQLSSKIEFHYTGRPAFVAEAATGMQSDLTKSVGLTVLIIILLFWWAHRRWRPLLWLLALLAMVLVGTLGLGGLFYGRLNVVSVGFAAILLGLAVDYGLVLYQESLHDPDISVAHLRRTIGPGILWSAVTTSGAFAMLNFGGMPGLGQLGSLVAIGVFLGAAVMVSAYLPPLMHGRIHHKGHGSTPGSSAGSTLNFANPAVGWFFTAAITAVTIFVLLGGFPHLDHSAAALRPVNSEAFNTAEAIQKNIGNTTEPYWLIVSGTNAANVSERLQLANSVMETAQSNHVIRAFTLPTALWPHPKFQTSNRSMANRLAGYTNAVHQAAITNGFTSNSVVLAENMMRAWSEMAGTSGVYWPRGEVSDFALGKVVARETNELYALGIIYPETNAPPGTPGIESLEPRLPNDHVWLAGWDRLGSALLGIVERDFWRVMLPMVALLLISLWLAFKRVGEVLLSLLTLAFSFAWLLMIMRVAGWSWNLLNMMAVPLLLGSGVDYSIHMQIALRRHHGNINTARRTVGRALLLCAATTVAGFGSNVFSSNEGLVSLGEVCATGIAIAYLTGNFLLPVWWKALAKVRPAKQSAGGKA